MTDSYNTLLVFFVPASFFCVKPLVFPGIQSPTILVIPVFSAKVESFIVIVSPRVFSVRIIDNRIIAIRHIKWSTNTTNRKKEKKDHSIASNEILSNCPELLKVTVYSPNGSSDARANGIVNDLSSNTAILKVLL